MRPNHNVTVTALATLGFLITTVAAMAAPNAYLNRDTNVRRTANASSAVVNTAEEDDDVEVLQCNSTRCKIKIPGPDGWVRKSYLEFFGDDDDFDFDVSISLPFPPVPGPGPGPSLPYGPDTCDPGFVWRDAIPGDHVCVATDRRTAAASENAVAGSRVDPLGPYGPNTCVGGFVWRGAYAGDVVCVTPARRDQVYQENIDGPSHRVL